MLDIKYIIENQKKMIENLELRNIKFDFDSFIDLYNLLKLKKQNLESFQKRSNEIANEIKVMLSEKSMVSEELKVEGSQLKTKILDLKKDIEEKEIKFNRLANELPNWISPDVPKGIDDSDNKIISSFGIPTEFEFEYKDHLEIGKYLNLIDFEAGSKVAGSKFYFLKNELVLLQHALKSYVFEKAIKAGFMPLQTPDIAYNHILAGVGFSPRGEESNTYELKDLNKSLIATAEICVGGMHSNEIIDQKKLPLLYVAESHCFRREAGAGGQSSKGLYRVHQFEKIELFVICHPDESEIYHNKILFLQEEIYSDLKIPYRVVVNSSGDLGAPAYKKYDIEAWMPGKGKHGEYGEITSASNCTEYQARRLEIKFKDSRMKKNQYVHTLNGTAMALGRVIVAILENFQTDKGSVKIPNPLRKYVDFDEISLK